MYPIFFFGFAAFFAYQAVTSEGVAAWLSGWTAISGSVMGAAYLFRRPGWVAGKSNGELNPFLVLVNAPWLALTYLAGWIQAKLSKESPWDRIGETNVTISRYPFGLDDWNGDFDLVVDLTCELPSSAKRIRGARYESFPNLDGVPLVENGDELVSEREERILVHCAQGHGRSAIFTSRLLVRLGWVESLDEGLHLIRRSRPKAVPSPRRRKHSLAMETENP